MFALARPCLPPRPTAAAQPSRAQRAAARPVPSPRAPPTPRRGPSPPAGLASETTGDDGYIMSAAAFDAHLASAPVVVVDFMARWCRKCIYVKPRLVALMKDKFPHVPLAFVDVNGVPSDVVRGAGVSKMPTLCVYVKGEQVSSYIAGDSATTAVLKLETLVADAVKAAKKAA